MDLAHWIERHAAFSPDKPAILFAGSEISYAALAADVRLTIRRLVALGLRPGEVVAFLGFNHPANLVLLFACARIGAILLPLNWRLAVPEHARVLADAAVRVIIVEAGFVTHAESLRARWPDARWLSLESAVPGWSSWQDIEPAATPAGWRDKDAKSDPLLLCYTSGSTGAPKGVVLTQEALLSNALNSTHMHDLTSSDRILTTLPLYHVGGLNILTLPALHAGATVELHPKFDPDETFDAIEGRRITLTVLVPAQLAPMMQHPRWPQADLSSLRMISTGSTIVSSSFVRRVNARGPLLIQVYGSTETSPIATYLRASDADRKAGSAGLPALHCEVRIVDANGHDLPPGGDGEILVRGANVMRDYWNRPELTAQALEGGWYHSGDIGHFDSEGYLYVVSRKNDLIISGGENIYPAEIEAVLEECPAIAEVSVVGRPDECWGETVVAAVALKPGAAMSEAEVLALLAGRIARYKQPREVRFVEALPRSAIGKVKKQELRASLIASATA
jgi:fatty-acyl-CoA synthase